MSDRHVYVRALTATKLVLDWMNDRREECADFYRDTTGSNRYFLVGLSDASYTESAMSTNK